MASHNGNPTASPHSDPLGGIDPAGDGYGASRGRNRANPNAGKPGQLPTRQRSEYAGRPTEDRNGSAPTVHTFDSADLAESAEEYICPTADKYRQSTRFTFQAPPYIRDCIAQVLKSGMFPFQNEQDVLRHAIFRTLEFYARRDRTIDTHDFVTMRAMHEVHAEEKRRMGAMQCLKEMDWLASKLIQDGDNTRAYQMLGKISRMIVRMPATSTRRKFETAFNAKYRQFMDTAGRVAPQLTYSTDIDPGPDFDAPGLADRLLATEDDELSNMVQ